jgi:hypothetical protein
LICCPSGVIFGINISYSFVLASLVILLVFLSAMASIEVVFVHKQRHLSHLLPLKHYAQVVSALLYVVTTGSLSAITWLLGHTENDALSVPLKIFAS